jgi:uncharacterized linocin/CFP29 family protein
MSHLLRSHAPISEAGWSLLDDEARARLTPALGARAVVDFSGPHGWEHSATNLGRTRELGSAPAESVAGRARTVLPLVELRVDFELARTELFDADRGAPDPDLAPLDAAARRIAVAENSAVFGGLGEALGGVVGRSPHERLSLGEPGDYSAQVATAVSMLLGSGVGGPYALALGDDQYAIALGASDRGGYPLSEHLRTILEGPIVSAPGLNGAVVLSRRGGDFLFDCGQDLSVGYASHDDDVVGLYIEESFSFRVATPEAAVALSA